MEHHDSDNESPFTDDIEYPGSRYGMDPLGILLLVLGIVCVILSFFGTNIDPMLFTLPFVVGVVILVYEAYRAASTDLASRAKENEAFTRHFKKTSAEDKERLKKEREAKRADAKAQADARRRERERNRREDETARKAEEAAERDAQEHPGTALERCPECGQSLRVPVGKGAIRVTCPKCKNAFIIHT
ncbi:MAG: hypothetical protein ACOX1O_08465 [Eggerthellaceae bacterium]|jgi:hypothetical protein